MSTYADAWISEMWKPCRELSVGERTAKRQEDRRQQRTVEEWVIHTSSTGCPETHPENVGKGAA